MSMATVSDYLDWRGDIAFSRIIAIADTYSAITMRRAYKDPKTHEEAIEIMKNVAGAQLDKDLMDIFVTIPKEGNHEDHIH